MQVTTRGWLARSNLSGQWATTSSRSTSPPPSSSSSLGSLSGSTGRAWAHLYRDKTLAVLAGKFEIVFGGISILNDVKVKYFRLFSEDQNGTEHSQQRTLHYSVDIFFPQSVCFFSHYRENRRKHIIESREVLVYRIA
jgi:hypothetical protein